MSIRVRRVWRCDVCGNRCLERDLPMHAEWKKRWFRVSLQEPGSRIGKIRTREHFDTCSHRCRTQLWERMVTQDVPHEPWVKS